MEAQKEEQVEKIDLSAEEEHAAHVEGEGDVVSQDITSRFDAILGNHLDRLLGTRQGIETLPMNIFTVSCLILLATRETEIQTFPYLPPERYTDKTMVESLAEMNIGSGENIEVHVKTMLEKGYMHVSDDGRFFADAPAIKMAQLLDRIFPRLPGLNLVAYLGQMIDEVFSKRKELKVALSQFDQMLNLHGISLKRDAESGHGETGRMFPHLKVGDELQPASKKIVMASVKPSDIFSKLETKTWMATSIKQGASLSSNTSQQQIDTQTINATNLSGEEPVNAFPEVQIHVETAERGIDAEVEKEPTMEAGGMHSAQAAAFEKDIPLMPRSESRVSTPETMQAQPFQWNGEQPEDDDVEKRIMAFEEQLGMACPLCRTAGILPQVTAKGKKYYKCANDDCNFISWGKPYYIACPKCENPFLIESPDAQGNMMLKCPRATCPHWQKFPWEEDDEPEVKSSETLQTSDAEKKPRKVVKRRRRVVVRRRA